MPLATAALASCLQKMPASVKKAFYVPDFDPATPRRLAGKKRCKQADRL
jgi:hypothetical protein